LQPPLHFHYDYTIKKLFTGKRELNFFDKEELICSQINCCLIGENVEIAGEQVKEKRVKRCVIGELAGER
jgi:hypothetical protein